MSEPNSTLSISDLATSETYKGTYGPVGGLISGVFCGLLLIFFF